MPHFPTCTICGLLTGDKILHDKWHRDLDARIAGRAVRAMKYPCCEHCGHLELGESPGHEYPCRVEDCQ